MRQRSRTRQGTTMRDTLYERDHNSQQRLHTPFNSRCHTGLQGRPQFSALLLLALVTAPCAWAQGRDAGNALASQPAAASTLPDAPSTILAELENGPAPAADASSSSDSSSASEGQPSSPLMSRVPCPAQPVAITLIPTTVPQPNLTLASWQPPQTNNAPAQTPHCPTGVEGETRVQPIINRRTEPLTAAEKGKLALRDFTDPFNLFAVTAYSGISIAINSHSAYGPGFKGFGKLTGYSLSEDAQGEFLGTFLIPVLAHEDPRYRREPDRPVMHRFFHAVEHTFVAEHDDGRPMPNYARLFMYPASAELSDLYVPGVQTDLKSTGERAAIGIATDPIGNIVEEFLPDVASHIHIHVLFFQEILNRVATGHSEPTVDDLGGSGF